MLKVSSKVVVCLVVTFHMSHVVSYSAMLRPCLELQLGSEKLLDTYRIVIVNDRLFDSFRDSF